MSIKRINLRKLLQLVSADPKQRSALLKDDIRAERRKERGEDVGGGDFFVPFWAAAKGHAKRETNLAVEIPKLIAANNRRSRLYPILSKSFLEWWNEKRAWRNEPFHITRDNIKGHVEILDLELLIKVENLISGTIGESEHRLVYPYFSEKPRLSLNVARLGLHILHLALPEYYRQDFRILDILRSISFSIDDVPFTGTEDEELYASYHVIREEYNKLSKELV